MNPARRNPKIEPYWLFIALFSTLGVILLVYHWATGETPDRIALHIRAFDFDIFWYGILIIGGIALGTFVTSRLAMERARLVFSREVPADLRGRVLGDLGLPESAQKKLLKQGVRTAGDLLLEWGLNPARLGLKRWELQEVYERLSQSPDFSEAWLGDAPWRPWNPDYAWGGVAWCLILGVIGARLYHILTPSPSLAQQGINSAADYFRQPLQLINLRNGGLGIYGGIAGGALGLLWYAYRHRLPALAWADLAAVGTALGQFVGRWGNFLNQELYGSPTKLPWGIFIDAENRIAPYQDMGAYPPSTRFHPAFLYESLWSLLAFLVLLTLARRYQARLKTGDLAALYLVFYALGRIILETVRLDSRSVSVAGPGSGLPVATLVSLAVALPLSAFLLWRHAIRS